MTDSDCTTDVYGERDEDDDGDPTDPVAHPVGHLDTAEVVRLLARRTYPARVRLLALALVGLAILAIQSRDRGATMDAATAESSAVEVAAPTPGDDLQTDVATPTAEPAGPVERTRETEASPPAPRRSSPTVERPAKPRIRWREAATPRDLLFGESS